MFNYCRKDKENLEYWRTFLRKAELLLEVEGTRDSQISYSMAVENVIIYALFSWEGDPDCQRHTIPAVVTAEDVIAYANDEANGIDGAEWNEVLWNVNDIVRFIAYTKLPEHYGYAIEQYIQRNNKTN